MICMGTSFIENYLKLLQQAEIREKRRRDALEQE